MTLLEALTWAAEEQGLKEPGRLPSASDKTLLLAWSVAILRQGSMIALMHLNREASVRKLTFWWSVVRGGLTACSSCGLRFAPPIDLVLYGDTIPLLDRSKRHEWMEARMVASTLL